MIRADSFSEELLRRPEAVNADPALAGVWSDIIGADAWAFLGQGPRPWPQLQSVDARRTVEGVKERGVGLNSPPCSLARSDDSRRRGKN